MEDSRFELEILAPGRTDVFLAAGNVAVPWQIIEQLDRMGIRVVGPLPDCVDDSDQVLSIMRGCSGTVIVQPNPQAEAIALDLGVPRLTVIPGTEVDLDPFQKAVLRGRRRIRSYAFMVGRLERDFRQARDAIRAAVEYAAGIPCLWIDDGRHQTNVESIRERTRLLIKNATFVIADLSLGVENPERENPSRAHEIGMAIAYSRPLMLCSQEPRRYPYYSIGDMQMAFWLSEDELETTVEEWIRAKKELVAHHVFNYQLPASAISSFVFTFDPQQRFVGPNLRVRFKMRHLLTRVGIK
jgi:hypothetical protein